MDHSFLICGFPRSRTLWFSQFLSIRGYSYCTHEATEYAGSACEFWNNSRLYAVGCEVYGNSDSANIFVLPGLLAERPMTKVIWIARPIMDVCRSMRHAGMPFNADVISVLQHLRDKHSCYFDATFDYDTLCRPKVCEEIWRICLPALPFDYSRWDQYNTKRICYSKENPYPKKNPDKFLGWMQRDQDEEKEYSA